MAVEKVLEVLTETLRLMLFAERTFPARSGEAKQVWVMGRIESLLDLPSSLALSELGNVTELLETIGELISLIVKLFNLLGVFRRAPPKNTP